MYWKICIVGTLQVLKKYKFLKKKKKNDLSQRFENRWNRVWKFFFKKMTYPSAFESAGIGTAYASAFESAGIGLLNFIHP